MNPYRYVDADAFNAGISRGRRQTAMTAARSMVILHRPTIARTYVGIARAAHHDYLRYMRRVREGI